MAQHKGEQADVLWSRDNYTFGKNKILEPLMYIHNMCNIHERVLVEIIGTKTASEEEYLSELFILVVNKFDKNIK